VKSILMAAAMVIGVSLPVGAQPAERIAVMLDARTEGRATRDEAATRLLDGVRRGATPGPLAASVIVTERYDRETLMVLGIEDDDMALRMMALQIVVDHQIFTGRDAAALAPRIVTAINDGIFAKLRTLKPKP
jgi:hypothetical protein